MISGGSRSFAKGEGQLLFQPRNFKNGFDLFQKWIWSVYGEIRGGSDPQVPPLNPPLVIEVTSVDSTDTDADSLMKSTN